MPVAKKCRAPFSIFVTEIFTLCDSPQGHSHATTTDIYVRSAGLYGERSVMMDALGKSSIGIAAEQLLEMEMPRRLHPHEAFCKHASVNNRLQ